MEELSLWAPGIVGLVVAGSSLFYAHWIAGARPKSSKSLPTRKETSGPFDFSPPTVLTGREGSVRVHAPAAVPAPERVN